MTTQNRTDNTYDIFTSKQQTFNVDATGKETLSSTFYQDTTPQDCYKQVTRGPITKTVMDSDGFRPPTPYQASWLVKDTPAGKGPWFVHTNAWAGNVITRFDTHCVRSFNWKFETVWYLPTPEPFPSYLVGKAVNGALKKFEDQNVNYLLMAAEASKSISMISSYAKIMLKAIRYVKSGQMHKAAKLFHMPGRTFSNDIRQIKAGDVRDATKIISVIASRWLELQYGWKPLINDIEGVRKDYTEKLSRKLPVSVRYAPQSVRRTEQYRAGGGAYSNKTFNSSIAKASYKHVCKVRLDGQLSIDKLRMNAMVGLGFADVAVVAWELIPYSFMLDWVVPIGGFLDALDSTVGLTFRGGSITKFSEVSHENAYFYDGSNVGTGSKLFKSAGGTWYLTGRQGSMDRQIYSDFPRPVLYAKNPWSTLHAANALALFVVAFTGAKPQMRR